MTESNSEQKEIERVVERINISIPADPRKILSTLFGPLRILLDIIQNTVILFVVLLMWKVIHWLIGKLGFRLSDNMVSTIDLLFAWGILIVVIFEVLDVIFWRSTVSSFFRAAFEASIKDNDRSGDKK